MICGGSFTGVTATVKTSGVSFAPSFAVTVTSPEVSTPSPGVQVTRPDAETAMPAGSLDSSYVRSAPSGSVAISW